ncbi:unnamed protein product [[Candida] boidinii]|uniref:Unnamed protein product n=1 Tax=Candida boidinii TaxID=5477 RepID=A0A9W6WG76_CANBO|nr:hypothetical protein B5S30_g4723 [[Candida] boidinii]GME69759.1 unnamed protein product [[Candida] boidinii]GMF11933.1 unnamed protein product [[Candida] boidinii]GMG05162.1 unnamed protein product [[Candida] boidinii]
MSTKPTIAVLGTNGFLGKPIIAALQSEPFVSKIQLPIRAITRDPSKYEDTEVVKYYKGDLADVDSLKDALTGVDVFINVGTFNEHFDKPLAAIEKYAKDLKLYIPSQFGTDLENADFDIIPAKVEHSKKARAAGIKTIDICCSLFAVPGGYLYDNLAEVGYDSKTNVATIRGDPDFKFDISFLPDIGKAVAAIATAKDYSAFPDRFRISSDKVSQEQVLKRYEEAHNVKIERKYISKEDTFKEGAEKLAKGFSFADFYFYLQYFISQGTDKGLSFSKNENDLINPNESVFKYTKFP